MQLLFGKYDRVGSAIAHHAHVDECAIRVNENAAVVAGAGARSTVAGIVNATRVAIQGGSSPSGAVVYRNGARIHLSITGRLEHPLLFHVRQNVVNPGEEIADR